jgi:hypothetical protein
VTSDSGCARPSEEVSRPPASGRYILSRAKNCPTIGVHLNHPAFYVFGATLRKQGYDRGFSPKRRSFWQLIPPGTYDPGTARDRLEAYLHSLENALREVIQLQSLAYWLHLSRRFSPLAMGDDKSSTTVQITRAVLDAAIQKYAQVDLCNRVAISNQVDPTEILQGFLVAMGHRSILDALASCPQLVLTDFGLDEYRAFLDTEKLAYEVWRTMAQLRIIGKGAPLVVMDGDEWVVDGRDNDLDYLVTNFDRRGLAFSASATGTVFKQELKKEERGLIILPQWNVDHVDYDQFRPVFKHFLKAQLQTRKGDAPNFIWTPMNIATFYGAHSPFSEPFRERNGVSLESVVGVIIAMIAHLFVSWSRQPDYFCRMWQRAYEAPGKPADIKRWINEILPAAIEIYGLPFDASTVGVDAAFDYLSLVDAKRSEIDIGYGGPHALFIPNGRDQVFIDYAYLLQRLNYLFYGVNLRDQNFKGAALEVLTHRGASALPTGELKSRDSTSRQVDAAFALDDVLVICECRATARSIAVERGDPQALAYRRQVVEKALTDIDEKAQWLCEHRLGTNYDVRPYRSILPMGVTPFKEFIHSREARFWVSDDLPRVLSPGELQKALNDGSLLAASKNCHNVLHLD